MKNLLKLIPAGLALMVVGAVMCVVTGRSFGFDPTKMGTTTSVTKSCELSDSFRDISINEKMGNIRILPAEDGKCSVTYQETEGMEYTFRVEGDKLVIKDEDKRGLYLRFSTIMDAPEMILYLPEKEYGALNIKSTRGDAEIGEDFLFDSIDVELEFGEAVCKASAGKDIAVSTSAGTIHLDGLHCRNLRCKGDAGGIYLKNVIADSEMQVSIDAGDITFSGCDGAKIIMECDTGSISGSFRSAKIFHAKSDTGKVRVPDTKDGGECVLTTDVGDISVSIEND